MVVYVSLFGVVPCPGPTKDPKKFDGDAGSAPRGRLGPLLTVKSGQSRHNYANFELSFAGTSTRSCRLPFVSECATLMFMVEVSLHIFMIFCVLLVRDTLCSPDFPLLPRSIWAFVLSPGFLSSDNSTIMARRLSQPMPGPPRYTCIVCGSSPTLAHGQGKPRGSTRATTVLSYVRTVLTGGPERGLGINQRQNTLNEGEWQGLGKHMRGRRKAVRNGTKTPMDMANCIMPIELGHKKRVMGEIEGFTTRKRPRIT